MLSQGIQDQVNAIEEENIKLKQLIRELNKELTQKDLKPQACEYCKHWIRHYIKDISGFKPLWTGHCTVGRSTKPKAQDGTCKRFELGKY